MDSTDSPPATEVISAPGIQLKVGIIGAGIAGLAAAIALTDSGHDVEIFEKSRFANEIGAGIHMTPNSTRVLKHYDFDFEAARGSDADEMAYLNWENGEMLKSTKYPDVVKSFGARWLLFHRGDLHAELKRQAVEQTTSKRHPARLQLRTHVDDVDLDGTIRLANRSTIKKDLVVIANGIHTELAEKVSGAPIRNEAAGTAMIRFLIPMEEVANDPRTKPIHEAGLNRFLYCINPDGRNFVSYPCKGGAMANCAIFFKDNVDWQGAWSKEATREDLLKVAHGYHETFIGLCDKANDISIWRLATREKPVETLVRDRLVLTGDASHPMLPFLGQGAAMAVEDAAALGVFMSDLASTEDVNDRLRLFQQLRHDRVCAMQILSSWGTLGYAKVFERSKPYFNKEKAPTDREELNDWCFRPDIRQEAIAMLQDHLKSA
ncbi:hypothetical protein AMS68_006614 [Peltaster fructicola]|uniref:FAD-binding domain-containing protein n=1 Tax=Peltaster fructicola TaxID=286661 RepID=A0A6H0Y281_9PEZI|nr:hypothetical protein AMS68_006614 [Peltaster fructicola]